MSRSNSDYIVWIDTELTGLDIERDTILEIACLITDKDLNIKSEEFNVVINQPDSILGNMNEWNTTHHTENGLIYESQCSKIDLKKAEEMLLNFIKKYVPKGCCPLAGNTVYMDCLFLLKWMPLVHSHNSYRIIDVSSVKELVRRWNPRIYENLPEKQFVHRALPDIKESIQELKYYKENIFISSIV
ncbi:putative oligoribonuclease [Andrena cerasifolii]|uniref:putative oligoribonuclease n=1 Tax=Andrena cerasifolii TaxID=2819439 RepID=UPI00403797E9